MNAFCNVLLSSCCCGSGCRSCIEEGQKPDNAYALGFPVVEGKTPLYDFINNDKFPRAPSNAIEWFSFRREWNDGLSLMGCSSPEYPIPFSSVCFVDTLRVCAPGIAALVDKDRVQRSSVFNASNIGGMNPYHGLRSLFDAFDPQGVTVPLQCDKHSGLIRSTDLRAVRTWTRPTTSGLALMQRWFHRTFPMIPWYTAEKGYGVVVAGGFVLMCMFGLVKFDESTGDIQSVPPGTDIDVFVVIEERLRNRSTGEDICTFALSIAEDFVSAVTPPLGVKNHDHVINVPVNVKGVGLHFQIVKSLQKTPSHVVNGFDIWGCMVLFDGDDVRATEGAIHQLTTGIMVADATKASKSWAHRLHKYAYRYGFAIYAPGVPQRTIDRVLDEPDRTTDVWIATEGDGYYPNTYAHIARAMKTPFGFLRRDREFKCDYNDTVQVDLIKENMESCILSSPWTINMHDSNGHFTGSFNPVKINPYEGLDRYV